MPTYGSSLRKYRACEIQINRQSCKDANPKVAICCTAPDSLSSHQ